MTLEEFDYDLKEELIAQTPLADRDSSKLLILNKETGEVRHHHFRDIVDFLDVGDTLVVNDTKVIPARLVGEKEDTKAIIEILLLKNIKDDIWECLAKPAKRIKEGTTISFGNGLLKAKCVMIGEDGIRHMELIYTGILYEILDQLGTMPLPPYIHQKLTDQNRYQTVYAKESGSAAAPTAGLHFTEGLLNQLKDKGVNVVSLTLHVGLGTFRPVNVTDITKHKMHSEYYSISQKTVDCIEETKRNNKKVVVVGTTSVRVLETVMNRYGQLKECSGWTDIFIYPGYQFKIVEHLITNFHLPKSTLIMLISALASREYVLKAYQDAIDHQYRFFSFGDSMFITNCKK